MDRRFHLLDDGQLADPSAAQRRLGDPAATPRWARDSELAGGLAAPTLQTTPEAAELLGQLTLSGFVTDSAALTTEHQTNLRRYVEVLDALRHQHGLIVHITGHTDAVGTEAHNTTLGQRRADSVRNELLLRGIPDTILFAESAGEEQPLIPTDAAEPMNRRVEIRLYVARPAAPQLFPPPAPQPDLLHPPPIMPQDTPLPGPRAPQPQYPPWMWNTNPPALPARPSSSFNSLVYGAVDRALTPILRGIGIGSDLRERILEGAHDLVDKGISSGLDAALDAAHIQGQEREAVQSSVKALRQQQIR